MRMRQYPAPDQRGLLEISDTPSGSGTYEVRVVWPDGTHTTFASGQPLPLAAMATTFDEIAQAIRDVMDH